MEEDHINKPFQSSCWCAFRTHSCLRSKDHSWLMQTLRSALHRPNSRRTGWLVPVETAGISEVTVHREKETYFCLIPQASQVHYYYSFTTENIQGSKEKNYISAMVFYLFTLRRRGGKF